jgi:hypothetical protein
MMLAAGILALGWVDMAGMIDVGDPATGATRQRRGTKQNDQELSHLGPRSARHGDAHP